MTFVNTGAMPEKIGRDPKTGKPVRNYKTKAAFKRAVAEAPDQVLLYETSLFGGGNVFPTTEAKPGVTYIVVGPDPERDRRWYANLIVNRLGNVKIT
jgi:hypothetical protein